MSVLKELSSYIIGLIFIILGFLTFTYIEHVNQRPAVASSDVLYYILAVGFIFMIIGILFMIYFTKKDLKKKPSKKLK
jgi:ABC-type antimicrobial peptide transport system permease subunit